MRFQSKPATLSWVFQDLQERTTERDRLRPISTSASFFFEFGQFDFGQFRLRPISTSANFDFGQFRLRPISTSANLDFGQFRLRPIRFRPAGRSRIVREVELAEVEHPQNQNTLSEDPPNHQFGPFTNLSEFTQFEPSGPSVQTFCEDPQDPQLVHSVDLQLPCLGNLS